jgi:hypothetical protein
MFLNKIEKACDRHSSFLTMSISIIYFKKGALMDNDGLSKSLCLRLRGITIFSSFPELINVQV